MIQEIKLSFKKSLRFFVTDNLTSFKLKNHFVKLPAYKAGLSGI